MNILSNLNLNWVHSTLADIMDVERRNRVSFEAFERILEPQIHIAEEVGNTLEVLLQR